jgi:hypothetical protein
VLPRHSLQLVDSSAVLGAGAVTDTYELLRRGIGQLVRAAGEPSLSKALRRKLARYLKASKPRIDWHDPTARRAELGRMVAAADRLLAATAGRPELAEAAELLRRLVDQDVERTRPTAAAPRSSSRSPRTGSSAPATRTCATAASPSTNGSTATRST